MLRTQRSEVFKQTIYYSLANLAANSRRNKTIPQNSKRIRLVSAIVKNAAPKARVTATHHR